MQRFFAMLFLFALPICLFAQSPVGVWKTIDDETGEAKSHVEIFEKDGKLYGKVVKLLLKPADTKCEKCSGAKKDKPVVGMTIIEGMEKDGSEWEDGTILDPENGKTYTCKFWLSEDDPNKLKVRGYIAFFYRTQDWYRVK